MHKLKTYESYKITSFPWFIDPLINIEKAFISYLKMEYLLVYIGKPLNYIEGALSYGISLLYILK